MSTQENKLKAIADAIREKDGTTEPIPANDFAARILAIQGGGGVTLESISITAPPDKVAYRMGELFDPTGLSVCAMFSNGQSYNISNSDLVFDPAGPLTEGTSHVVIRFQWGTDVVEAEQTITVAGTRIFGVSWDFVGDTKGARTDDSAGFIDPVPAVSSGFGSSPFDSYMPWAGLAVIDDPVGGKLVSIPKFWFRWTKKGDTMQLQIANDPVEGFLVSPAHADRGDGAGERDMVYVGRYHCTSNYKSETGLAQNSGMTRETARSRIKQLGSGFYQWDWAMNWTIKMLYLVEYADWDSQKQIGYGCSANNVKENNGKTDAMQYHTGTTAAGRTTFGFTQYRGIEGLWDNVCDWVDGCYYNNRILYVIMNPALFSDGSFGTAVETAAMLSGGYPSKFNLSTQQGLEWCIIPAQFNNSGFRIPDTWGAEVNKPVLFCGGYSRNSLEYGLFFTLPGLVNHTSINIGTRLMKLPNEAQEAA